MNLLMMQFHMPIDNYECDIDCETLCNSVNSEIKQIMVYVHFLARV